MTVKRIAPDSYWRAREETQRQKSIANEAEYQKEIDRIYAEMLDNIQTEINNFYAKYAAKEGITMAEAKKKVSQMDIDAYARKAKKYVKTKDFSKQANEEMRLYNAAMKINRLEMLKANIGLEMVASFDELQKFFDQTLTDETLKEFRRQAGILGETVVNNQKYAHAIVNASFHNATYSERIWGQQDQLRAEIGKQIAIGLIQGKHSTVLARNLRDTIAVSKSDAERLMTTELRRAQTEVAKQSYERNGNTQYEFMTTNPQGACPICKAIDGKIFNVKDMMPGENAPPMHPRCHCATAPHWDQEAFDKWLEEENSRMHAVDQPQKQNKPVANSMKNGIIKPDKTISGHDATPKEASPGSVVDHVNAAGEVDVRTFYNEDGLKGKDVHTTNHGNPKWHTYGKHGEHAHDYDWDTEKNLRKKITRDLTEDERKENDDIL